MAACIRCQRQTGRLFALCLIDDEGHDEDAHIENAGVGLNLCERCLPEAASLIGSVIKPFVSGKMVAVDRGAFETLKDVAGASR